MTTADKNRTGLERRAVLAAAVSGLVIASAAGAQASVPPLVDLQIVDRETGREARIWRYGGRQYVAGRPGGRYSVRVTNNTPERVLV